MTTDQENVLNLVNRSIDTKFNGNKITGHFTFESKDDIVLIKRFEAGDFADTAKFETKDSNFKVNEKISFVIKIESIGNQYASYESFIAHALDDRADIESLLDTNILVYEDKKKSKSSNTESLLPCLILIFKLIKSLEKHYYYKDKQLVIFAQTHCVIPLQVSKVERYLEIAKYYQSLNKVEPSSKPSVTIKNFTSWLNADISENDEVKKSLLVHATERNTIVASIIIDTLSGVSQENRIFSLLEDIDSIYQSVLSKYALYLDDFKFSKFNDKMMEDSEEFRKNAETIISGLQSQILAIPLAVALISISKLNVKLNELLVGSFLIYSLLVLYATAQQIYSSWILRKQIQNFINDQKIPKALTHTWVKQVKPIKRKICAHLIYLLIVIGFLIYIIFNCLDFILDWSTITLLERFATQQPVPIT